MPKDKSGNYHLNQQKADAADRRSGGTHTMPSGKQMDNADMPEHAEGSPHHFLAKMHAQHGGKHMHIHKHDAGHTTHHVNEDGSLEGPDEHDSDEALQDHVATVMGDGSQQGASNDYDLSQDDGSLAGM